MNTLVEDKYGQTHMNTLAEEKYGQMITLSEDIYCQMYSLIATFGQVTDVLQMSS